MDGRIEQLLSALVNGETTDVKPQSRIEEGLLTILEDRVIEANPQSRNEAYLKAISQKLVENNADNIINNLLEVEY
jgi:hypothetical protein